MTDELNDFKALMRRVSEGSEEAAQELVQKYAPHLRRSVRRLLNKRIRSKFDSLDFVQIVWTSLFRARGRLIEFQHPDEFAAFITTMCRNKVGMELRRRMRSQKYDVRREQSFDHTLTQSSNSDDHQPTPDLVAIARERYHHLVDGQPERHRRIIQLRLEGGTHLSIAREVGLSESSVRRFLKRLAEGLA